MNLATPGIVAWIVAWVIAGAVTADCRLADETAPLSGPSGAAATQRTLTMDPAAGPVRVHLAWFDSRAFRLAVVDLGDGARPLHASLPAACRAVDCAALVNGGFFHPDWRPLGQVIAQGRRLHRFEQSRLLAGVVYSDRDGIHLVRRARFGDHPGIDALLQSGPYLVENGRAVKGLSSLRPSRRTFIATDWRGHWVIGATREPLTLAALGDCLATPGVLTPWPVERALNLDGGSSSAFHFQTGGGSAVVTLPPWKRVRNLLAVVPR